MPCRGAPIDCCWYVPYLDATDVRAGDDGLIIDRGNTQQLTLTATDLAQLSTTGQGPDAKGAVRCDRHGDALRRQGCDALYTLVRQRPRKFAPADAKGDHSAM